MQSFLCAFLFITIPSIAKVDDCRWLNQYPNNLSFLFNFPQISFIIYKIHSFVTCIYPFFQASFRHISNAVRLSVFSVFQVLYPCSAMFDTHNFKNLSFLIQYLRKVNSLLIKNLFSLGQFLDLVTSSIFCGNSVQVVKFIHFLYAIIPNLNIQKMELFYNFFYCYTFIYEAESVKFTNVYQRIQHYFFYVINSLWR